MSCKVVHFEIHSANPEKAAEFYTTVFGWDIKKWEGGDFEYWLVMTCPKDTANGINGGLLRRKGDAPTDGQAVNGYVCTIDVPSYDEYAKKIEENGGVSVVPKMSIAKMAWQGYFKDPDGNIFGLHQVDKNAA
jgi:uncharacterized protein